MAYRGNYRGPQGFARPENALKRADELENVGQRQAALQALHDIVTSKKHRTWSKTFESIMFKHIDLVVEMKKRNYAKEALMQYRNMCQQVNINSLEEVIKYFLKTASDKAEQAQSQSLAVTIDVEDLEEDASPEDLMLSYVSAEKGKDRTDRELVTPWFRFLWEAYRSVLEILRTNPKLEPLYAMVASKAFQFCLQYKRTAEFRRLCDILRQHLTNVTSRYRESRESHPDMLQLHLEARFEQLKVACELELWAEAFRSVEDIQALIALAKRTPKQQMMATYYARLTQIFAVSENHMYHAYAWLKLYNFSKSFNKNMSQQDLQMMASSVLLSTLSILPFDRADRLDDMQVEQEKERILRMATILGFAVDSKKDYRNVLSRGALLSSINSMNVLALVPAEVRSIYELLTSDFSPLEMCSRLAPLFEKLSELSLPMSAASPVKEVDLAHYVRSLKQVAILRLIKQLGEVYSTLKVSSLAAMIPFANFSEVEAIVVDAVRFNYLQVRVDHRNGTLHFGSQQLESERIRGHLAVLAGRLGKVMTMVQPDISTEKAARRAAAVKAALECMDADHRRATARKILIEKRKEEQETALLEAEKEEAVRKAQLAREAEVAEEKRRREEMLRREKERLEKELEEKDMEEARAMLEAANRKRSGATGKAVPKDGEKLDKKQLMQEAMTERLKEQQDLERKMTKTGKQLDHLERARREEEIPYILALHEARIAEDKTMHEAAQKAAREAHRAAWEADVLEKERLSAMMDEKAKFQAAVVSRREEEFEQLREEHERRMAEKRVQRAKERDMARRREFVRRSVEQVNERVAVLEEEHRLAEELRQKEVEKERERKLEEVAEKQRQREAEIEARQKAERAALPAAAAPPASGGKFVPSSRRAEAAGGGGGAAYAPPSDDRWGGGGRSSAAPPAAAATREDGGDRWGGGGGGDAGGRYVPSRPAGATAPPPARDAPPSGGGGGGAYRPPNRRT